jgi:hypothetical protein
MTFMQNGWPSIVVFSGGTVIGLALPEGRGSRDLQGARQR